MNNEEAANLPKPDEQNQALEKVVFTDEQLEGLTDERLQARIDFFHEHEELEKKQKELNNRAIKLGLLKLANQAPRCSHVKANGKPCRAPAFGGRLFCVYHGRALETKDGPGIDVKVLEDRKSLQLAVKQIMSRSLTVAYRAKPPRFCCEPFKSPALLLSLRKHGHGADPNRSVARRTRRWGTLRKSLRGPEEKSG